MPVMLVVFDRDGLPLDVKGANILDADAVAAAGATLWSVAGEIGEVLGGRVSLIALRAGSVEMEVRFGVDAGYALVVDEAIAALLEEVDEEGGEEESSLTEEAFA